MLDYVETFDKFAVLRRLMAGAEHDLSNDRPLSAASTAQLLKIVRMAEAECQSLLMIILRIRGVQPTVRRHGEDCAMSYTAGYDAATKNVTLVTTDVITNLSESHVMPAEVFERLIDYFQSVVSQSRQAASQAAPP